MRPPSLDVRVTGVFLFALFVSVAVNLSVTEIAQELKAGERFANYLDDVIIAALVAGLYTRIYCVAEKHAKMVADMNHHVRNALQVIVHSKDANHVDEEAKRILWALENVLDERKKKR